MILARQHQPGGHKTRTDPYEPTFAWPDNCYVQWGSHGLVINRSGPNYLTAFFEAFPKDPQTFIRGEGATLAEAEQKAFARWTAILACPEHVFERRGYTNGAGFCTHCHLFMSKVFEPTTRCSICGEPTCYAQKKGVWFCEADAPPDVLNPFAEDGDD